MSGPAAPVRPLPLIGLTPVAEEDMNRFKLIAEQLANAPFRECMLAQNLASGHPTSTVSNYMKGDDIIAHMVDSTDSASGLDKVKTEEEAIVLFERMLSAHLVAKPGSGKVVQAACPPLALRVHALRKEPSQADKDRALADLLRTNPHASMEDVVLPKGQQEKRDGLRVFFPTAENPRLSTKPDSHPLRLTPAAQYVLVHKKDMTNTLWMYLGGLAAVVLAATTFRLWPVFLQVGVWYISVTVLVVILGFYSIQLLIFGICWGFGFEVWVFPKMFDERYWWTEWFTEPLDARYVGGLWLLRACAIAALAVAVGWAVSQPEGTMEQMQDHSAQFFDELYSGKLLEGAAPTQFGRVGHIPTFDELQRLAEQEENDRETAAEDGAGSPVEGSANDSAEDGEQHGDKSEGSADEDESEGSADEDESEGSAEDEDGDEDDEQAALADAIMNAMAEGDDGEDGEDEEEGAEASSDGDEK